MGRCDFCGEHAPVAAVTYRQNTGMLVMRRSRQWEGDACRGCGKQLFWKATLHTFFLGWWGTISFFVTPVFIIGNIISFLKTARLPSIAIMRRDALDGQTEYARNLLATKDRATVVEVLARDTGAPLEEVEAFVARVEAARIS